MLYSRVNFSFLFWLLQSFSVFGSAVFFSGGFGFLNDVFKIHFMSFVVLVSFSII